MKKHLIPSLLLCAALTLGAATLSAQAPSPGALLPPPPPGHRGPPSVLFRALDTNGDGVISADEIANAPAVLKTLAGESGQIMHESLRPPRRREGGDERRSDGDAPLRHPQPNDDATRPHRPRPEPSQDAADGAPATRPQRPVSPDAEHGPCQADASPAPDGSSDAGRPPDDPAGRHRHGLPHDDRLFGALDTDGDGVISADEAAAAANELKKADTNGDGIIDRRDFGPPTPPAQAN